MLITKYYYLVRHAEKQDPNDPDTPISEIGRKRAIILKNTLKNKNIGNIIVSQFKRTQQTAKPLEVEVHLAHTVINNEDISKTLKNLEKHLSNSLVVGHTNNIPLIIKNITGDNVAITENDYDNLFIITVTNYIFFKKKRLRKTTYGVSSP